MGNDAKRMRVTTREAQRGRSLGVFVALTSVALIRPFQRRPVKSISELVMVGWMAALVGCASTAATPLAPVAAPTPSVDAPPTPVEPTAVACEQPPSRPAGGVYFPNEFDNAPSGRPAQWGPPVGDSRLHRRAIRRVRRQNRRLFQP
jgi:hypothetical protein